KAAIGEHVVNGAPLDVRNGTKAALHYRLEVPAGETATVLLRLADAARAPDEQVLALREREADEFYSALIPADATEDEARIVRQALAGMLWPKQFYHYDVLPWLRDAKLEHPRNTTWWHLNNADVISMPDKWEYPWYAAWDLAFHCVALAHVDAEFAKEQLVLLCRECYMHPNGQLPAYEWALGDVNPPVHAWAALRVFEIDGAQDVDF